MSSEHVTLSACHRQTTYTHVDPSKLWLSCPLLFVEFALCVLPVLAVPRKANPESLACLGMTNSTEQLSL